MPTFIRDNWIIVVSVVFCSFIIWFAYGCEPTTKSLLIPNRNVNSAELKLELETLVNMYNHRIEDLDKKIKIQEWFFEQAAETIEKGEINPIGLMTSLLSVLGIGAGADNLRVRKKLKYAHIETNTEKENA